MTDRFFDDHQRETIEAAMARIIPTDDQPGAREARTIDFLDRYLSGIGFIHARPDGSGFEVLAGKRADAWRQRIDILRERYLEGIEAMNGLSRERFREDFALLVDKDQDDVLAELERRSVGVGTEPAPTAPGAELTSVEPALQQTSAEIGLDFFALLALHTRQGFLADPIYGGNRDRIGWTVIGFPGPSSLAEVHLGRYSSLDYFAEAATDLAEDERDA